MSTIASVCQLSSVDGCHHFITLRIHVKVQHAGYVTVHLSALSATDVTYIQTYVSM